MVSMLPSPQTLGGNGLGSISGAPVLESKIVIEGRSYPTLHSNENVIIERKYSS